MMCGQIPYFCEPGQVHDQPSVASATGVGAVIAAKFEDEGVEGDALWFVCVFLRLLDFINHTCVHIYFTS